jgi:predicted MFS family arabinose efflux permease
MTKDPNYSNGLTAKQRLTMATAAGICVANIYYNQPILKDIADSLGVSESRTGWVAVLTQCGYGLGLFFIVPLGDKFHRKRLILLLQAFLIFSLAGISVMTSVNGVYVMSLMIGLSAVATQVILPMAASFETKNRGKTVAIVFTGILVGVLSARLFSGLISAHMGWRYVYRFSALLVLLSGLLINFLLPDLHRPFAGNYRQLLESTLQQVKRFAQLRRTALLGALIFGIFTSFWTTLTFQLSGAPFFLHADAIGLFGLLAIGGVLAAPVFGKQVDKGNALRSYLIMISTLISGILLLKIFPYSLSSYIIAVLFIDMGTQAIQVTNLAIIYSLDEKAHSRINTVYMTSYFIGGAIGTLAGVLSWTYGGWQLVTSQQLLWGLMALVLILYSRFSYSPSR